MFCSVNESITTVVGIDFETWKVGPKFSKIALNAINCTLYFVDINAGALHVSSDATGIAKGTCHPNCLCKMGYLINFK